MTESARQSHSLGFRLAIALLALLAAAKPILFDSIDPDCFWHLRVAAELKIHGIGPLVDTLCFDSIRTPWTPYSWLAEFGMAALWNVAGWRGAVTMHALMSAAFVLMLAATCDETQRLRGVRLELNTVLAVLAGCVWSLAYLSFRPATAAIDLLASAAWLAARDQRMTQRSQAVWLIVPIALLLANIHLTAVLLPVGLALWLTGNGSAGGTLPDPIEQRQRRGRSIALVILTGLASIATPMLPGVIRAMRDYSSRDPMVASPVLAEMRPFYSGGFGHVSAVLVVITLIAALIRHRRLNVGDGLLLGFATVLLFRLGRFAPLFAIVAVPVAALTWRQLSDRALCRKPIQLALGTLVLICVVRLAVSWPGPGVTLDAWLNRNATASTGYPTDSARWVEAHVPPQRGRLICEFNWGGYLGWRLDGKFQTLMDGRTQVQTTAFWQATYLGDVASRRQLLAPLDADVAIVPTHGSIFLVPLQQLGWRTVFTNERETVLLPP